MEVTAEQIEIVKIVSILVGIMTIFGCILGILRWFKTDTSEMIKMFTENTNKRLEMTEQRIAAIEILVIAIKEEVRDFHCKICEINQKSKQI